MLFNEYFQCWEICFYLLFKKPTNVQFPIQILTDSFSCHFNLFCYCRRVNDFHVAKTCLLPPYNIPYVFPFETLLTAGYYEPTHITLSSPFFTLMTFFSCQDSIPSQLMQSRSFLCFSFQHSFLALYIPPLPPHSHNMDHCSKYLFNLIPISMINYCFFPPVDIPACFLTVTVLTTHVSFLELVTHTLVPPIIGFITFSTCSSVTLDSPFSFTLCNQSLDPINFTFAQYLKLVDPLLLLLLPLKTWLSSFLL